VSKDSREKAVLRFAEFVITATLLIASPAVLRAQTADVLTLDDALHLAEQRSERLIAQESAATAARDLAMAASQAPDPTLKVGLDNVPVNGADAWSLTKDFMTMRSIGIARELTRSDKRDARSARFEREAEAADAERGLALAALQRGTATAWLDRYYREQLRQMLLKQRDEAALQVDAADITFRRGRGSEADVFAARSAVAAIEDRIAEADRDVELAKVQLARWLGDAAARPLGEAPGTDTVPLHAQDLEAHLALHPEIVLMRKQEEVALAEADLARANKRSDWTVEVMYSQRGPDYSNLMSVNVSKPLQWRERNRQDQELAAKLATAQQLRAMREEESREHIADARGLLVEWQSSRDRLRRYMDALLPLAAQRTAAALAAYRGGTGTLGAVLEARAAAVETGRDYLSLEMETARLWAEINYLIPTSRE
jgi:outer membrane protein TolC